MPLYTLIHGGLTVEKKHYPAGSQVELSTDEANRINARGEHVKLTEFLKIEAEAEKKKNEAIAEAIAKVEERFAAEKKAATEKKGGAK